MNIDMYSMTQAPTWIILVFHDSENYAQFIALHKSFGLLNVKRGMYLTTRKVQITKNGLTYHFL